MATYNLTRGTTGYIALKRTVFLVETTIDFAQLNSGAGAATSDVIRMINIPAGTLVLDAGAEIMTTVTSAGSLTFSLGVTGVEATKYVSAFGTLTAGYMTGVNTDAEAFGSLTAGTDGGFDSADTIDLLCNDDTALTGIVRVWALMVDTSQVSDTAGSHKDSAYDTAV